MKKQPLFICCIALILGIFIQDFIHFDENKTLYWTIAFFFITTFLFLFSNKLKLRFSELSVPILFIILGIVLHGMNSPKNHFKATQQKEEIIFSLNQKLNSSTEYKRYKVDIQKVNTTFPIIIYLKKSEPNLDFEHLYKTTLYLNTVPKPQNDYNFDYAKFLSRQGIFAQGYATQEIFSAKKENLNWHEKWKQRRLMVLEKIDHAPLSAKTKEFTKGIILADRTDMDTETIADFQKSGLAHILAISGTHIAIIFGFFYFFFRKIFPLKLQKFSIIFSLISIWAFAFFIGLGNSVSRACIMISCYFIFQILQRKTDTLHALSLAAIIILLTDTQQIFSVGFQLSFAAVLGIFWLNRPIEKLLPKPKNKFLKFLNPFITLTISAQISTLPLVLFYFHQFSGLSLLSNIILVPLAQVFIIFALIITIFLAFGINFNFIFNIYDGFISFLLKIVHWFSHQDLLFSDLFSLSILEVFLLFALIYSLRFLILKHQLKHYISTTFILLIFISVKFYLDFKAIQRQEFSVHHSFKNKYFSIKTKNKAIFFIKNDENLNKIKQHTIKPYLRSRRISEYRIKKIPKNTKFIQWRNQKFSIE